MNKQEIKELIQQLETYLSDNPEDNFTRYCLYILYDIYGGLKND